MSYAKAIQEFTHEDYANCQSMESDMFKEFGIKIANDDRDSVTIESSSGSAVYSIAFSGTSDDGYGKLWECNCPAGSVGKMCKHVKLVAAINGHLSDEWGYE